MLTYHPLQRTIGGFEKTPLLKMIHETNDYLLREQDAAWQKRKSGAPRYISCISTPYQLLYDQLRGDHFNTHCELGTLLPRLVARVRICCSLRSCSHRSRYLCSIKSNTGVQGLVGIPKQVSGGSLLSAAVPPRINDEHV